MFGVRVLEESPIYGFFLNRYGDGWIYLPLEGNHPLEEERAVLQLFHTILAETNPRDGGDILEIASEDPPRLQDTGFPEEAEVDLLFHAARRLADKGLLEAVPNPNPRPKNFERNYGNTYFKLPANVRQYVRVNAAEDAAGGNITGSSYTFSLLF